jgi:ankyrin repeat protein
MRIRAGLSFLSVVIALVTSGCWIISPASYDVVAYTAVHQAALDGDDVTLKHTLETNSTLVNVPDYDKNTLLHLAVMHNRTNTVSLVLGYKADVNARNSAGMTPLHLAAREGYSEVTTMLLATHPKVNLKDNRGWTPLKWAQMSHHDQVASLIEQAGGRD